MKFQKYYWTVPRGALPLVPPQPIVHPTTKEVQAWMTNVITPLRFGILPIFLRMSFHSNMSHILQQKQT